MARRGTRVSWAATAAIALAALLPLVAATNALRLGWQATGDVAIIGIRSLDAWTADAPLLGQSSSGEEVTGIRTSHPGPIEYWWAGPWVRLLGGRAGLVVSVALLNSAALAATLWLALRNGGAVLLALVAALLAGLVNALGAVSLYDPFNSELATYPMVCAAVATWAVLLGDLRAAPVLAMAFTVAAQTHVATAALVTPLLILAVASVVRQIRTRPRLWSRYRRPLLASAAALFITWSAPMAQELSRGPSNLRAMYLASATGHVRVGVAFTLERFAAAVAPPPLFLRSVGRFGFLARPGAPAVLVAALMVAAAITAAALVRQRGGHRAPLALVVVALVTTGAAMLANQSLPPLTTLRADTARWLWVVSMMWWLALAWSALRLAARPIHRQAATVIIALAALVAPVLAGAAIARDRLSTQRDGGLMAATDAISDRTLARVPGGTYLLRYQGARTFVTIGPGLAFRLEASGRHVLVEEGAFDRGYGAARVYRGQRLDGTLRVVSGAEASPEPGETEVAQVPVSVGHPELGLVTVLIR